MQPLYFLVPGELESLTGGYAYDREIIAGLRELGWDVTVHRLDASFPRPTSAALSEADAILGTLPAGRAVIIDGLALPGLADTLGRHSGRLRFIALVHHPVALEPDLSAAGRTAMRAQEIASFHCCERCICTSQWTAQQLAGLGLEGERIITIEPGTQPAVPARRRVARIGSVVNLLCVATVTRRKGHDVLLRALAACAAANWHLHCVGSLAREPDYVGFIRELARTLNLASRLSLHGECSAAALAAQYTAADIFVLASRLEGYGMVLAEALRYGLPIVATAGGAVATTTAGGGALLAPVDDHAGLALHLQSLISDPAARTQLAAAARQAGERAPRWPDAVRAFAAAVSSMTPR